MVTPERELIFFLNGRQIGTGTATTSGAVFAFCDVGGFEGDSVRLIPDLREVRKWIEVGTINIVTVFKCTGFH